MDRPGVCQVPEGSAEQRKMEEAGYEIICGALVTLTAELQRRMRTIEMRCYRKRLSISYKDHVTNEEVRAKFQQAIGPHQDLLTMLKRRKLQWYGHVSRSSGLANLARHSERGKKIFS